LSGPRKRQKLDDGQPAADLPEPSEDGAQSAPPPDVIDSVMMSDIPANKPEGTVITGDDALDATDDMAAFFPTSFGKQKKRNTGLSEGLAATRKKKAVRAEYLMNPAIFDPELTSSYTLIESCRTKEQRVEDEQRSTSICIRSQQPASNG